MVFYGFRKNCSNAVTLEHFVCTGFKPVVILKLSSCFSVMISQTSLSE